MPFWRADPDWRKQGGYSGRVVDAGESDLDLTGGRPGLGSGDKVLNDSKGENAGEKGQRVRWTGDQKRITSRRDAGGVAAAQQGWIERGSDQERRISTQRMNSKNEVSRDNWWRAGGGRQSAEEARGINCGGGERHLEQNSVALIRAFRDKGGFERTCQSNMGAVERGRRNAEAGIGAGLGGAGCGPSAKSAGIGMFHYWKGGGEHSGTDQLKTESASVKSRKQESSGREKVFNLEKEEAIQAAKEIYGRRGNKEGGSRSQKSGRRDERSQRDEKSIREEARKDEKSEGLVESSRPKERGSQAAEIQPVCDVLEADEDSGEEVDRGADLQKRIDELAEQVWDGDERKGRNGFMEGKRQKKDSGGENIAMMTRVIAIPKRDDGGNSGNGGGWKDGERRRSWRDPDEGVRDQMRWGGTPKTIRSDVVKDQMSADSKKSSLIAFEQMKGEDSGGEKDGSRGLGKSGQGQVSSAPSSKAGDCLSVFPEEDNTVTDMEVIFSRLVKVEEIMVRSGRERVELERKTNYLNQVLVDLQLEAEEDKNCTQVDVAEANFGSTDIRLKKKKLQDPFLSTPVSRSNNARRSAKKGKPSSAGESGAKKKSKCRSESGSCGLPGARSTVKDELTRAKMSSAEKMAKEKLRHQGEHGSCSTPVSESGCSEELPLLSDNLEVITCDQVNVGGEGTFEEPLSQSEEEEIYSRSQVDVFTVL